MTTTIMTPEEVLKYGKRILLFSTGKRRQVQKFVIEDGRIFQEGYLYLEDCVQVTQSNRVEIMDIYDKIERVYSQKKKGVLIARRSGNYKSNQQRLLPLKKTGKGMGHSLSHSELAKKAYEILDTVEHHDDVKRAAQERLKEQQRKKELAKAQRATKRMNQIAAGN